MIEELKSSCLETQTWLESLPECNIKPTKQHLDEMVIKLRDVLKPFVTPSPTYVVVDRSIADLDIWGCVETNQQVNKDAMFQGDALEKFTPKEQDLFFGMTSAFFTDMICTSFLSLLLKQQNIESTLYENTTKKLPLLQFSDKHNKRMFVHMTSQCTHHGDPIQYVLSCDGESYSTFKVLPTIETQECDPLVTFVLGIRRFKDKKKILERLAQIVQSFE